MDKLKESVNLQPIEEFELLLIFQSIINNIMDKDEELKNEEN
jgi:hypothetical protein